MVDAQAAQILATTDQIAERVRKTGNTTLRSVADIGRHQSLKDNDKDFVKPDDMLVELRDDNLKLVEALREAKDIVDDARSEEHPSALQSLMRISYAVLCLKKPNNTNSPT